MCPLLERSRAPASCHEYQARYRLAVSGGSGGSDSRSLCRSALRRSSALWGSAALRGSPALRSTSALRRSCALLRRCPLQPHEVSNQHFLVFVERGSGALENLIRSHIALRLDELDDVDGGRGQQGSLCRPGNHLRNQRQKSLNQIHKVQWCYLRLLTSYEWSIASVVPAQLQSTA